MKPLLRFTTVIGISLTIILLLITNSSYFYTSFLHNAGMLHYQRVFASGKISATDWEPAATILQRAIKKNSNDGIANLRLAGLFTLLGEYSLARQYAKDGLAVFGRPTCYLEQHDFLRLISTPSEYIPEYLLDFAHPQSRWRFEQVYLATGEILFDAKAENQGCIARIVVDHDASPNRFVWLWQEVQVKPNTDYQFSATVRVSGLEQAWLGIRSQWTGIPILNSSTWQPITYGFRTQSTQTTEAVQFVIEAGHGILEIDNIALEAINP